MMFGMLPLTGEYIANSFGDSTYTDNLFIQGFVKCISYDDQHIRPECYGYRIFLDPDISVCFTLWSSRFIIPYTLIQCTLIQKKCLFVFYLGLP